MGKLFSRPKAPQPAPVVYEPLPVAAPAPAPDPLPVYAPPVATPGPAPAPAQLSPVATPAEPAKPDPEAEASQARVQNLLRRRRGRAGTVETSWRGVLEANASAPLRKSLLGD